LQAEAQLALANGQYLKQAQFPAKANAVKTQLDVDGYRPRGQSEKAAV
jgi:hypothetical protein